MTQFIVDVNSKATFYSYGSGLFDTASAEVTKASVSYEIK